MIPLLRTPKAERSEAEGREIENLTDRLNPYGVICAAHLMQCSALFAEGDAMRSRIVPAYGC